MAFSRKQYHSIVGSTARTNIWEGSVRSGKTIASIFRWLQFVRQAPMDGNLLMVGKTHTTLRRNILDVIQAIVGKHRAKYVQGKQQFILFGRTIDCVGANDESAQDKIRGATVAGAYGDEIALWPESFFKMLLSRMSVKGAMLLGTTNPDSPYHWLKTDFIDREAELNLNVFHFTLDDNLINLDPEYVKAIKQEYTGLWYKRFIEGLWVLAEGVIYDMWDEAKHMADVAGLLKATNRDRFKHRFAAIDYGTANPFAAGLFGYDRGFPCYLEKEYYYDGRNSVKQKTDSEYADDMVKFFGERRPSHVYIDPSALSFITEMKRRAFNVVEAKNDVLDGIRFVGSCLHKGVFKVDHGCVNSKKEFSSYVWDEKAQEKGEDKPIKSHDHCMDFIRYGLFTHFYREHPQILTGFNFK